MLEQELFDLLEGTSDAAFAVTDQGEICSWNKVAEELFGYSSTEAISDTCYNLLQERGALCARVCGQNCGVRDCAARHREGDWSLRALIVGKVQTTGKENGRARYRASIDARAEELGRPH